MNILIDEMFKTMYISDSILSKYMNLSWTLVFWMGLYESLNNITSDAGIAKCIFFYKIS